MAKVLSVLIPFRKPEPANVCILHLLFKKFPDYQSSAYWFSFLLGAEPAKEVNSDTVIFIKVSPFTSYKPHFDI